MWKLLVVPSIDLSWNLDFRPLRPWPENLPAVAVEHSGQMHVVAGFSKRTFDSVQILSSLGNPKSTLKELWPQASLAAVERIRFCHVVGDPTPSSFILDWPFDLQNLFDS